MSIELANDKPAVEPQESAADQLARLGMDGLKWAEEFERINPGKMPKDVMLAWFANAIMAGWDHHYWTTPEYKASIAWVTDPGAERPTGTPRCTELDRMRAAMGEPTSPAYLSCLRMARLLEREAAPLAKVRAAIQVYDDALKRREHGGVAADRAINQIREALGGAA